VIGCIWLFEAAFMLVPLVTALAYGESAALAFLWTALICLGAGLLLSFKKPKNQTLRARDGFVVVSLSWIAISLLGALPFMFTGVTSSYVDALFETVSGFTTTGATIFADVESLPNSILMWRSFTHWIGGMGVLVFILTVLPMTGGNHMNLMKAESPGPSVDKLVPKVQSTAKILYSIYVLMTVIQIISYVFLGIVPWYKTLADTKGRRPFFIFNAAFLGVAMLIGGLTKTLIIYLIASTVITFFTIHDMQILYVVECVPENKRGTWMGIVEAVGNAAAVLREIEHLYPTPLHSTTAILGSEYINFPFKE
jgi:trk system potassium uptake protein TrkH